MPRTPKAQAEETTEVVRSYLEAVKGIPEVQMVVVSGRKPDWVRLMTFAVLPDDYDEETPILHRIFGAERNAVEQDEEALVAFDLRRRDLTENCGLNDLVPPGYRILYRREGVA